MVNKDLTAMFIRARILKRVLDYRNSLDQIFPSRMTAGDVSRLAVEHVVDYFECRASPSRLVRAYDGLDYLDWFVVSRTEGWRVSKVRVDLDEDTRLLSKSGVLFMMHNAAGKRGYHGLSQQRIYDEMQDLSQLLAQASRNLSIDLS